MLPLIVLIFVVVIACDWYQLMLLPVLLLSRYYCHYHYG